MAIIRFTERPNFMNPWAEFERIRRNLDLATQNLAAEEARYGHATVFPPINLYEKKDELIIKAEISGVKPEDLNISLEGETLTIKGARKHHASEEQISFHRREIERGTFSRAVTRRRKLIPTKSRHT